MQETSTSLAATLQFRQDIEAQFRRHIREALDVSLTEENTAATAAIAAQQVGHHAAFVEKNQTSRINR